MTAFGCIVPLPADSNVTIRAPSSVSVRMWAVVSDPSRIFPLTAKVTRASPLRNDTSDTEPTFIPDTVTGLPTARPPASENTALYRTAVAHEVNRSGARPTRMTSAIKITPMIPALTSPAPRYLSIRVPCTFQRLT
jgi:hypothetical protein